MRSFQKALTAWCIAALCAAVGVVQAQAPANSGGPVLPQAELAKMQQTQNANQPGNNNPVWQGVRSGREGTTTLGGIEGGVLIQNEGQRWRAMRNGQIAVWGGWGLVGLLGLIGLFYAWKGSIGLKEKPTGRVIERFTPIERMAHWSVAISFTILALSGLILAFGKTVLLPIIGYSLFGLLANICKTLHNFIGPLFIVASIILFFTFVRDNFPRAHDFKWLASFGGLISGKHIPSDRFNAGEKVWFWGGLLSLGVLVGVTGLILDFPNFNQTRSTMQLANMLHFSGALLFIAGFFGHVYMGTLGMKGAYKAMREGYVDEAWAKEHHEHWYNDVKSGKIPAMRSQSAAPSAAASASRPT